MLKLDYKSSVNRRFSGLTFFSALALIMAFAFVMVILLRINSNLHDTKAYYTKERVARAFHRVLRRIENYEVTPGVFTSTCPRDLGLLLRNKGSSLSEDEALMSNFPLATPDQLAKLKQIASGPSTLTPEDAEYVESVANIRYLVPPTGEITEGQLLIYTIKPDEDGLIWLGYASVGDSDNRIDRVPPAEVAAILAALDKSPSSSETSMESESGNKNSGAKEGDK